MVTSHMLGIAVYAFRDLRILPVKKKITEKKLRTRFRVVFMRDLT